MRLNFFDSQNFADMVRAYKVAVLWGSTCEAVPGEPESMTEMDNRFGLEDFSDSGEAVAHGECMAFTMRYSNLINAVDQTTRESLMHTLALSQMGHGVSFRDTPIPTVGRAQAEEMAQYARNGTLTADAEWEIGDDNKVYLFGHEWRRLCTVHGKMSKADGSMSGVSTRADFPAYSAGHAIYLSVKDQLHTQDRVVSTAEDRGLAYKVD